MTWAVRLSAALLLLEFLMVSPSGVAAGENSRWEFATSIDPITDARRGTVLSLHSSGGHIAFNCESGNKISDFLAVASTRRGDEYRDGLVEVSWRIDNAKAQTEMWEANSFSQSGGVGIVGKPAYEFALAVARAQSRIVFRNVNGTAVFSAKGSTKAISQLLQLCNLGG